MADKFTVWYVEMRGDVPQRVGINWSCDEPAEAADVAESQLQRGIAGESYCEIRFNGDVEPHTIIFLMEEGPPPTFGIWNSPSAMWPIFYPDGPYGYMMEGNPLSGDEDGSGEHKKDDDSDRMKLDGMDDEPEPDTESEGDSEEFPDDEEGDDEDDENTDEEDDPMEPGDDENDSEERDDDEEDESEGNEEEEEDGLDDEEGENETDQEEAEMPRLRIFAKMRGPKGWRKRAEAEELLDRNVFALKVGVLDPEAETPGKQERNVVAHVEFIESDETRDHGILKLRLPEGITPADFTQTKAGVISVQVPYSG